jgi:exosortase/archaeosortase
MSDTTSNQASSINLLTGLVGVQEGTVERRVAALVAPVRADNHGGDDKPSG